MRSFRAILTAWMLVLATSASAQTLVTLTTRGTMTLGSDGLGLFTTPGSSLQGLPFTLSITGDPSYLIDRYFPDGHVAETDGLGLPVMFRGELTINGHTYPWQLDHGYGSIDLLDPASGVRMGITAQATGPGETLDGKLVSMSAGVDSAVAGPPLAKGTSFDQAIELTNILPASPYSLLFSVMEPLSQGGRVSGGQGVATYALWTASPVPEPGSSTMFAAGAGLLLWMRKRSGRRRR